MLDSWQNKKKCYDKSWKKLKMRGAVINISGSTSISAILCRVIDDRTWRAADFLAIGKKLAPIMRRASIAPVDVTLRNWIPPVYLITRATSQNLREIALFTNYI